MHLQKKNPTKLLRDMHVPHALMLKADKAKSISYYLQNILYNIAANAI